MRDVVWFDVPLHNPHKSRRVQVPLPLYTVDARQDVGVRALRSGIVLLNDLTLRLAQHSATVDADEFGGAVVVATAIAIWVWEVDALDVLLAWISVFALDGNSTVGASIIERVLATVGTYERCLCVAVEHRVYVEAALQNAVDNLGIRRLYDSWSDDGTSASAVHRPVGCRPSP